MQFFINLVNVIFHVIQSLHLITNVFYKSLIPLPYSKKVTGGPGVITTATVGLNIVLT